MRIYKRSEWGAAPRSIPSMSGTKAEVFIHHTAGAFSGTAAQEKAHMRQLEAFHVGSRGMTAIAYSFLVFPSGRVYEGRGWGKAGGHTAGYNSSSYAICFVGNFEGQKPTTKALDAAVGVIAEGISKGHIRKSPRIRGHRDVGQTACPGKYLYARLTYIREGKEDELNKTEQDAVNFSIGMRLFERGKPRPEGGAEMRPFKQGWDFAKKSAESGSGGAHTHAVTGTAK